MVSERISLELRKVARSGYWIGALILFLLILFAAVLALTGAPDATRQVHELVDALGPVLCGAWLVGVVASFVASLIETSTARRKP